MTMMSLAGIYALLGAHLIAALQIIIYAGAITDDRNFDKDDKATNYVINAVRSSVSGIDVAPGTVRPWGCSVKYPDGGKGRKPRGRGPGRKP